MKPYLFLLFRVAVPLLGGDKLSLSRTSVGWGCFQACVFSRNHTGYYSTLGLAGSLQGNNLPAEKADLLKPLLLCERVGLHLVLLG